MTLLKSLNLMKYCIRLQYLTTNVANYFSILVYRSGRGRVHVAAHVK